MKASTNSEDVQFYLDRSQEALAKVLRSIVENPRLTAQERFEYLRAIYELHNGVALFIQEKVLVGQGKGYDMIAKAQTA